MWDFSKKIRINDKTAIRIFLVAIFVVALLRSLYRMGSNSFWLDEVLALCYFNFNDYPQAPLFYSILKVFSLVSVNPLWLRLPSVIFSAIAAPMTYFVGKKMFGHKPALVSGVLMAVSPYIIFHAQEARPYILLLLLSLFSYYYFMEVLKKGTRKDWILLGVFNVLVVYTHYFGALLIFSELLYFVYSNRRNSERLKKFFVLCIVIGIIFSPLAYRFYLGSQQKVEMYNWGTNAGEFPLSILGNFGGQTESAGGFFVVALMFLFGVLAISRNKKESELFFFLYLIPFLIAWILSPFIPILPKYLIFLLPLHLLVFGKLVAEAKPFWSSGLLLSILLLLSVFTLYLYYYSPDVYGWNTGIGFFEDNEICPDYPILVEPRHSQAAFNFHYYEGDMSKVVPYCDVPQDYMAIENSHRFINRIKQYNASYFFYATGASVQDYNRTALLWLWTNCDAEWARGQKAIFHCVGPFEPGIDSRELNLSLAQKKAIDFREDRAWVNITRHK